jgi:hypothetical protein
MTIDSWVDGYAATSRVPTAPDDNAAGSRICLEYRNCKITQNGLTTA